MLKEFEKEAIRILAYGKLPDRVIQEITGTDQAVVRHTGAGYFLSVRSRLLPVERMVLNEPVLKAVSGELTAGLIVFIENSELTLECHGWGDDEMPKSFRESGVVVSTT